MLKVLLISIATGTLSLFLTAAQAEDSKNATANSEPVIASEETVDSGNSTISVMDQPVNFSTPEEVAKSLQKVREQEGENAYKTLDGAMKYVLYYDLSIGGKKENLYKKLDGKTPTEIINMMKR